MRRTSDLIPVLLVVLAGTMGLACADSKVADSQPSNQPASEPQVTTMKIHMTIEHTAVAATLDDNETARDFASLLPLTLTLKDYAATEKISDLPKKLSTRDAPRGYKPSAGDIAYYAPWGNLALFHRDFEYSPGLVRIGSIDSGIEALRRPGPLSVTFEPAEKQQSP